MQMNSVKIKVVLDERRQKKSGKYPVKLRLTWNGQQKYYSLNLDMTTTDYGSCMANTAKGKLLKSRLIINEAETRSYQIISQMKMFSFFLFEQQFFGYSGSNTNVYHWYSKVIEDLKANGQFGTASNYECSMHSLEKFKANLQFQDITKEFLDGYQKSLLLSGKKISTVGIYVRPLRHIYNLAIEKGIIHKEFYPFTQTNYQIPASRNIKKALTNEQLKAILSFESKSPKEQYARDIFVFSYFANGMNIKDIALLKYSNIHEEVIVFQRAKTANTSISALPVMIPINGEIKTIIERWKTENNSSKNAYIFGIVGDLDSLERQRKKIQQVTKIVNKYLGVISERLKIPQKVTTYYARHTFSTVMKNGGASVEFISESLGHTSINTTRAYLSSFNLELKKKMAKILTNI